MHNRIIIAGGRDFIADNAEYYYQRLDNIFQHLSSIEIISGGAKGADNLGETYAQSRGYQCIILNANWERHGKKAGILRNIDMAQYAMQASQAFLIAFWDGKSRGTGHMIRCAKDRAIPYRIIEY